MIDYSASIPLLDAFGTVSGSADRRQGAFTFNTWISLTLFLGYDWLLVIEVSSLVDVKTANLGQPLYFQKW